MPFQTLADVHAMLAKLPVPDQAAIAGAEARNGQLTKPPGALGRLEKLAIWMGGWQGTDKPTAAKPQIVIFAGNHGVTAKGVSAFPAEVTAQMVANFAHGGAAINQLARTFGAKLDVHALDLDTPTADFTEEPAMTEAEVIDALRKGYEAVNLEADLFVAGEMGIGNTTAAALEAANPSVVAISMRPAARPADLSRAVEAAVAAAVREPDPEPELVAAAAAAPAPELKPEELDEIDEPDTASAAPKIPTKASVAKQATYANAINLSKINLIGTYGTDSRRYALVRQSNGRYKKVKVGDKIDGGTVKAITETEVRYQKGGKLLSLKMPKA